VRVIADFILAYPRFILSVIIIIAISSVYPATQVQTDFNLEGFFPEDSPTIVDYQRLAEEFGRDDNAIGIAFKAPSVFSDSTLRHIKEISDRLASIPNIERVNSLSSLTRLEDKRGMLQTVPYVQYGRERALLSEQARSALLDDPFASNLLVSSDGGVTAIYMEVNEKVNRFDIRRQVISDLNRVLGEYAHLYDFNTAGIPFFRNTYVELLNAEILVFVSISSVLIIGVLWLIFGNIRGVLVPILIVWLTILFTVAFIVLTGGYFEIMSSTIAPILLCVGVADSIHLLIKYQDARLTGMAPGPAIRETLMILGSATLLTSITTAIGFATLGTSSVVPMQRFGYYTAAGVLLAFVITIFFLPSILPYFRDLNTKKPESTRFHHLTGLLLEKVYYWVVRNHKPIVITTLLITLVFSWGATSLKVNGKIFDDVDDEHPVMQQSQFFTDNLSPQFPLEFVIDTQRADGALNPDFLQRVAELENRLHSIPEVARTTSITTILTQVNKTLTGTAALPLNQQTAAQYMLLLELADTREYERLVNFDYSTVRVAANIEDAGSYRINQIRDEIEPWLRENFPDERVLTTGTSILVGDITQNIVGSLTWSIALAFLLIATLMGWLFRDLKLVLISILPNIIPLMIMAGTMGFLGIDLKPSSAVVFTIAFGIAVDDSIHFLARLRIELSRHQNMNKALAITTKRTGRAIVLTSIILLIGFGILITSDFTSTLLMGALVSQAISTALLADIFFLPAFLYWLNPRLGTRSGFIDSDIPLPEPRFDHELKQHPVLHPPSENA